MQSLFARCLILEPTDLNAKGCRSLIQSQIISLLVFPTFSVHSGLGMVGNALGKIVIIIIHWLNSKAQFRILYNLLTAPRTVFNTYVQAATVQSCASQVQHIERLAHATCRVPLGTKGQLIYQVWQSWNHIYHSIILLTEIIYRWRRGGKRSTRRKPLTTICPQEFLIHMSKTDLCDQLCSSCFFYKSKTMRLLTVLQRKLTWFQLKMAILRRTHMTETSSLSLPEVS